MITNRIQLGAYLKGLRANSPGASDELSERVVETIETGHSQYPVKKLIEYCNGIHKTAVIHIKLLDEDYELHTVLDAHKAIDRMLDAYDENPHSISKKISIVYTAPKDGAEPLAIDTLLAICNFCDSELIVK